MAKDTKQEEPKPKADADAEVPAQKKSKAKLFIVVGIVLLLAGGGGFAFWHMQKAKNVPEATASAEGDSATGETAKPEAIPAAEKTEPAKEGKKEPAKEGKKEAASGKEPKEGKEAKTGKEGAADPNSLDFQLDPVSVNLRDSKTGGVIVQFSVRAKDANARKAIEKASFPIRDALIGLVSDRNSADLQSSEGKELLKREVKKKLDEIVGPGLVDGLYYYQFNFFRG